jgi:hypothetical protein
MRRLTLALGSGLAAAALTVAAAPVAAAQDTGQVRVVHGIPDTPVDVYVDGQRALDDFQPGRAEGPLELPAGPHEVALFAADAPDNSGAPVLSATAEVPGGGAATLAAHLDEAGQPTITAFVDDLSAVAAGQARLVVRHTAAAPAVDVLAGGQPVISGLTNGGEEALELPASTVSAAVAAAGSTEPVLGPADLNLTEGTATFAYAIGSLDAGNLDLVVVTVDGLHSSPSGVPSGAPSGEPSEPAATGWLVGGLAVLAAAAAALGLRARTAGQR